MVVDDDEVVFRALADPTRRALLDRLFERDGLSLGELEASAPHLTRFGVMKHLAVLQQAGLVVTRKQGRFKYHFLNPVPITLVYERWVGKYREGRVTALLNLKDQLEVTQMQTQMKTTAASATQVYQLYIRATPEQVWDAITKPEIVAKYFHGSVNEGSYEVGGTLRAWSPDHSQLWTENTVLEVDPPRRLVHTWRALWDAETAAEPESRVVWEIERLPEGYSKLTVVHDRLDSSPKTAEHVKGWSYVLSSLKTLLETGEPLPAQQS